MTGIIVRVFRVDSWIVFGRGFENPIHESTRNTRKRLRRRDSQNVCKKVIGLVLKMPQIRTIIVDDEPLARRGLRQLLAAHTDFKVIAEARNGVEAISAVRSLHPDLLFLDVQMPEPDAFGVLKEIGPGLMPIVIFVTAYDEFAVRA